MPCNPKYTTKHRKVNTHAPVTRHSSPVTRHLPAICHFSFRVVSYAPMEESFSTRPAAGRLIALELRPTRPLTLLGPSAAVLCGAVAAGGLSLKNQSLLILVLSLLLCDALLGAWRALWLHAEWRVSLRRALANTQSWFGVYDDAPGSPLTRLSRSITRRLAFARAVVWPLVDSEIVGMLMVGILTVCVAAVLGQVALALASVAMLLALVEGAVGAARGAGLRAVVEILLPWLIAQSAFDYFSWLSFVFVLLFTLIYRALLGLAQAQDRWIAWCNLGQLAVVLILIFSNVPIGAAIVALGLLAQVLWQVRYRVDRDGRLYAQRAHAYVLVAMLVAGFSLLW